MSVLVLLGRGEAVSKESLDFLFLQHEMSIPVEDIKAGLSPAQLENHLFCLSDPQRRQQWHTAGPHTSLSLLTFSLLRDVLTSLPQCLSFFSSSMLSSLSLRAALTFLPAPKLIFSSLFLWDCRSYTQFTNSFFLLCRQLFHMLQPLLLQRLPSESSVTHHSEVPTDGLCDSVELLQITDMSK